MNAANWKPLPFDKKILNIASELGRAAGWLKKQDRLAFENSIERALELLDLTIDDHKQLSNSVTRELLRFREWLAETLLAPPLFSDFSIAQRCFLDLNTEVHELQLDL